MALVVRASVQLPDNAPTSLLGLTVAQRLYIIFTFVSYINSNMSYQHTQLGGGGKLARCAQQHYTRLTTRQPSITARRHLLNRNMIDYATSLAKSKASINTSPPKRAKHMSAVTVAVRMK